VVPAWQAEPVEGARPGTAASRSLPDAPAMLMLRVLGTSRVGVAVGLHRGGQASGQSLV
jgi:hypothetical protein